MITIKTGTLITDILGPIEIVRRRHRAFWRRADENGPNFLGGTTIDLTGHSSATVGNEDALYAGKDANGNDVLPRYPLESASRWTTRKVRAKSPSIVRHIVDHYIAHVFRGEVTRTEMDADADAFLADADGNGESLPAMLKKQARAALVDREAYLLLDTTLVETVGSAADAAAASARVIARPVCADQVLATVRSGGAVVEAVIELQDKDGEPFLWHVTADKACKATLSKNGQSVSAVGSWSAHDFAGCPLVAIRELPRFVPPVAESQKRLAVLDSLLQCELHAAAFSQPVFTGVGDPKLLMELIRSNEFALAFPNPEAKAFMLGSDPAQAASIAAERDKELENAYREAKVSPAVTAPGQPESGISRAYRFVDADVELAGIAEAIEKAERRIWLLLANAGTCALPTITYPISFIPTDDAQELNKVLAVSSSNLPNVIKAHFIRNYAQAEGLGDDELEQLETEIAQPDDEDAGVPEAT